jgi:glycosyltransferase involved in cell wall biosynthesis
MRILHVIERLSAAGPTRALISLVKSQQRLGLPHQHRVVTLQHDCYPLTLIMAKQAGLSVRRHPDPESLREEVTAADVVQLHFWNSPEIYRFIASELPPLRLLLWFHVAGDRAPQVVTSRLVEFADFCATATPHTLTLPFVQRAARVRRAANVFACADFDRLAGCEPRPHAGFNVGYVGTVNPTKMHPDYVAMSAAVDLPDLRFVVCGGGQEQIEQEAARLGAGDRFELRGFVEQLKPVYETLDIFGYPLCADTSAASELSLQEAMYVGVPPVVFPHGGIPYLVEDGQTGLIVQSAAEYTAAIERLGCDPAERRRLGENARDAARRRFAGDATARQFDRIYAALLDLPRRARRWPGPGAAATPAERFVDALGTAAPQFAISLRGPDEAAEGAIAASSPLLAFGEGGVLHYRNAYPDDPLLRFWSGLVLRRQGRDEQAGREFAAAVDLGLDSDRVRQYLAPTSAVGVS